MRFDFSVEQNKSFKYSPKESTNGLFRVLQTGYSNHIPVTISPDDILNNVGAIWAKYIVINSERFRNFFVSHEDKKRLTYISSGTYSEKRWPEFASGLVNLIKEDQENDNMRWLDADFSTTSVNDRLVRASSLLASQKDYYEYGCMLCCGFPAVTMTGTEEDWDNLVYHVRAIPAADENLDKWKYRLVKTINNMRSGDESFWQRCIADKAFGSGPQDYEGWILDFNPINEKGEWLTRMEDKDILNLSVDFEVDINDNGKEFKVGIEAGPSKTMIKDESLSPENSFSTEMISEFS